MTAIRGTPRATSGSVVVGGSDLSEVANNAHTQKLLQQIDFFKKKCYYSKLFPLLLSFPVFSTSTVCFVVNSI